MFKYIPVLKPKDGEYRALSAAIDKIESLLPYIEFTKPLNNKKSIKFLELLKGKNHFEQYSLKEKDNSISIKEIEEASNRQGIVVLDFEKNSFLSNLLKEAHRQNIPIAIRVSKSRTKSDFFSIAESLSKDDYLFLDFQGTSFQGVQLYLSVLSKKGLKCHVVILNQDRTITTATEFVNNPLSYLDTSYVEALNKGELSNYYGYANYATIKNEKTDENNGHGYSATLGICIVSQLDQPTFKVIASSKKEPIGLAYTNLNTVIRNNYDCYKQLFRKNKLSLEMLESYAKESKANACKYIALGALCYFEEMDRQISLLKSNSLSK